MNPRLVSRLLSALAVIAFLILGIGSFALGVGKDAPGIQCIYQEPPAVGGPYFEQTRIDGERTLFPLGIVCSYDTPGDAVGPQEVSHPSWISTIMLAFSLFMAARSAVLVVKPEAFGRH